MASTSALLIIESAFNNALESTSRTIEPISQSHDQKDFSVTMETESQNQGVISSKGLVSDKLKHWVKVLPHILNLHVINFSNAFNQKPLNCGKPDQQWTWIRCKIFWSSFSSDSLRNSTNIQFEMMRVTQSLAPFTEGRNQGNLWTFSNLTF